MSRPSSVIPDPTYEIGDSGSSETTQKPVSGDPKFDAENPNWLAARAQVDASTSDGSAWNTLIDLTEKLLAKYSTPTETAKRIITSTFEEALTRFPLVYSYWIKYTSVQYQLNGLGASLETLSRGLDSFPSSLDLWVEYLTLLIHNYEEDTKRIRSEFSTATTFVGHQFMSHTFWDKYIAYEQSQKNDKNELKILLQVTKIPLYQYATYYQALLSKKDAIPEDDIISLDEDISSQIPEGATSEIKRQIITDHITRVCQRTYNYVNEIWPFESKITNTTVFTFEPLSEEGAAGWNAYLDFQIKKYESDPSDLNKKQAVSLFERALIPGALYVNFWNKYITWALKHFEDDFDMLNGIYNRAANLFVPVNHFLLRLNYALFLEIHKQDVEKIHELYLNTIKYSPAEIRPIIQYIQFVSRTNENYRRTAEWIDEIISTFLKIKKPETDLNTHAQRLVELLNDKTVGVLAAELLNLHWNEGNDHQQIKLLLNLFSNQTALNGSPQYWTVVYRYHREHSSAETIQKTIAFIKDFSTLPLTTINLILRDYEDYLQQNLTETSHKSVLEIEYDIAHPFDYRITEEKQIQRARAESGHAGVFIEKPKITNSCINSAVKRYRPAPLPTFKNVEKAALPVEYPKDE